MKSMTGYACEERQDETCSVSVEIKGYNSRYLEIYVNLPPSLSALESGIREHISGICKRGKVEVTVKLKETGGISVSINHEAAAACAKAIAELATALGIEEKPPLALILGFDGVLETQKNTSNYRPLIEDALHKAAEHFDREREREGAHTCADILKHITAMEASVNSVRAHVPELEASIRENLKTRFAELFSNTTGNSTAGSFDNNNAGFPGFAADMDQGAAASIMENRILAETAVLLVKYTISEELSRLASHLTEFRAEAQRNPGPGKKLDFLSQEMNREVNTIGSKSQILEVNMAVVNMKETIENIREQLRNVE